MNIALVLPYDISYPGGVGNQVIEFAREARKRGHSTTIIAPHSGAVPDSLSTFISAGRAVPVPIHGSTVSRITLSPWRLPPIHRKLSTGTYDIIHVHAPLTPLLGLAALSFSPPSSVLALTFHSHGSHAPFTALYDQTFKPISLGKLVAKADIRIAVSKAARDFAQHYAHGNYTLVPNAINTHRFSPSVKPLPLYRDGNINILFVGRLGNQERRKGLEYLLRAFGRLHQKHAIRLIIAGPGQMDFASRHIYNTLDKNRVVLAGRISQEELPRYYATADIFCSPAIHGESFGIVLAEALASGTPVVTTNLPGHRAVVQKGTGLLVPPAHVEALASALEKLVVNRALRAKMGKAGRSSVVRRFSWDSVAPRLLNIYAKALAKKRR